MIVNRNPNRPNLVSVTPSGFFGKTSENIGFIDNFLTSSELTRLSEFAKGNLQWDESLSKYDSDGAMTYDSEFWSNRVATYPTLYKNNKDILEILDGIIKRLKPIIDNFFGVDASPTSPAIVKWKKGHYQEPHADKEMTDSGNEGKPNDFPWYDLSTVIYLNEDYDGGKLFFPQHDLEFSPSSGSVYFFPGDKNYVHGVSEITSGERFTCPFFWNILEHRECSNGNH
jgi:hypothetical protein